MQSRRVDSTHRRRLMPIADPAPLPLAARPASFCAAAFLLAAWPLAAAPRWEPATPFGGEVTALAQAASAPRTLYVGTDVAGVFRSLDGGATWSPTPGHTLADGVVDLAVEPRDAARVYATTRKFHSGQPDEHHFLRSTDGGAAWSEIGQGSWVFVTSLAFDRDDPVSLYVSTAIGLYRSPDGGDHWQLLAFPATEVRSIAIDSRDATFYAVVAPTVWKSTDRGQTWSETSLDEPAAASVVVDSVRPATLYVLTAPDSYAGPVYRSADGGASWAPLPGSEGVADLASSPTGVLCGALYLPLLPSADLGVIRSTDGGAIWWPQVDVHPEDVRPFDRVNRMLAAVDSPGTVFAAGRQGVWKSTDGCASWPPASAGIMAQSVNSIAIAHDQAATVYVGMNGGVFRSVDRGRTWKRTHTSRALHPFSIDAVDPGDPQALYGAGEGGLLKSTDRGRAWRHLPSLPQGFNGPNFVNETTLVAIDSAGALYVDHIEGHGQDVTEDLLRSRDGGETWQSIAALDDLLFLAVDPKHPWILYALTFDRLAKSIDDGLTWHRVGAGLPPSPEFPDSEAGRYPALLTLAVDPARTRTLYVGTRSHGVFQSTDGGSTFAPINAGLESAEVSALIVAPGRPASLYAGVTRQGVFRWDAALQLWTPLNDGLPVRDFTGVLAFDSAYPATLYAGTAGRGLFRMQPNRR